MIDDGHAVHYSAVERGTPIYSSDEIEVGTVEQIADNYKEHIFDGIVMRTPNGEYRFVDAPEVKRTAERGGHAYDHRGGGRAASTAGEGRLRGVRDSQGRGQGRAQTRFRLEEASVTMEVRDAARRDRWRKQKLSRTAAA